MHLTVDSLFGFPRRLAPVVAAVALISLAACEDVTAPEPVTSQAPSSLSFARSAVTDQLKEFGADMDSMTGWSLLTFAEGASKAKIVGILNGLKGHMMSGNINLCQDDVTQGRAWYAALSDSEQAEQGNISVTLDLIQSVLDEAGQ